MTTRVLLTKLEAKDGVYTHLRCTYAEENEEPTERMAESNDAGQRGGQGMQKELHEWQEREEEERWKKEEGQRKGGEDRRTGRGEAREYSETGRRLSIQSCTRIRLMLEQFNRRKTSQLWKDKLRERGSFYLLVYDGRTSHNQRICDTTCTRRYVVLYKNWS